jgi:proteic killer suppression protein
LAAECVIAAPDPQVERTRTIDQCGEMLRIDLHIMIYAGRKLWLGWQMIRSFKDRWTKDFFGGENVRKFSGFKKAAERKLVMLDSAVKLGDLASSPGNRLEKLSGDRAGQYSIRINDQWRICFT